MKLYGHAKEQPFRELPVALFLDVYFSYYDTPFPDPQAIIKCYIHSMLLIDRILPNLNPTFVNISRCLASDYDLESGVLFIITNLPITISFFHVKSHQDDPVGCSRIPPLAWIVQIMNVHTHRLATDYLVNYAQPSNTRRNINGITIIHRFPQPTTRSGRKRPKHQHPYHDSHQLEGTYIQFNQLDINFAQDHLPTRLRQTNAQHAFTSSRTHGTSSSVVRDDPFEEKRFSSPLPTHYLSITPNRTSPSSFSKASTRSILPILPFRCQSLTVNPNFDPA